MLQEYMLNKMLKGMEQIEYGSLTVSLPNGKTHSFKGRQNGAHGTIYIHDMRTVSAAALKGDIGLTESYRNQWWDTDDLTQLLLVGLQNEQAFDNAIYANILSNFAARVLYFFRRNSIKGSKQNIQEHYDLGNDFYSLWLDSTMSYSSAIFKDEGESLEQGQFNKYGRILDRLDTVKGSLLEVGCGWGGFAEQAAANNNYHIKGITLSEQQHAYANERLGGRADIVLEDYRHQEGKYDHIVSIEMFEAVGEKFWPVYFAKMKSLLEDKGKAVVQTITVDDMHFDRYRKTGDMIRTFIFPGGMLPSPTRFKQEAEKADLRVTDTFAFGQDYADTIEHWLNTFESKLDSIKALGFDEGFIRVWRFYLAACIATFAVGRTDVLQLELQHA